MTDTNGHAGFAIQPSCPIHGTSNGAGAAFKYTEVKSSPFDYSQFYRSVSEIRRKRRYTRRPNAPKLRVIQGGKS